MSASPSLGFEGEGARGSPRRASLRDSVVGTSSASEWSFCCGREVCVVRLQPL